MASDAWGERTRESYYVSAKAILETHKYFEPWGMAPWGSGTLNLGRILSESVYLGMLFQLQERVGTPILGSPDTMFTPENSAGHSPAMRPHPTRQGGGSGCAQSLRPH